MEFSETQFLKNEFSKRLEANPRYSLRAFARTLKVNPGTLSSLLQGKRKMTPDTAQKFCDELGLSPSDSRKIIERLNYKNQSQLGFSENFEGHDDESFQIEEEIFRTISSWYHYAILSLVTIDNYGSEARHSEPSWIAAELGIKPSEARLAIDRLVQLNLLEFSESGFLKRTKNQISTKDKMKSNGALRKWQKELRQKAIDAIDETPLEKRSITSMTMAVDPEKIPEAKLLIDQFQKKLAKLMESGSREKVYQLTVSLFPLQKD